MKTDNVDLATSKMIQLYFKICFIVIYLRLEHEMLYQNMTRRLDWYTITLSCMKYKLLIYKLFINFVLFYMKPDTTIVIISEIADLPLQIHSFLEENKHANFK